MSRVWKLIFLIGLSQGVNKAAADCDIVGKFPNDDLPDCRGFTTCTQIGVDLLYSYSLGCPTNFIFNHLDSQCSNATGYHCFSQYNCTTEGNFDYLNDSTCSSYIACVRGIAQLVTARLIECPPDTVFSPIAAVCVDRTQYSCPRLEMTTVTVTSTTVTTSQTTERPRNNSPSGIGLKKTSAATRGDFNFILFGVLPLAYVMFLTS